MLNLEGVITALITPFQGDGVDIAGLKKLVEGQIAAGMHGLLACGTTGETPALTEEEYSVVINTVLEASRGRIPVLAGTGTNCTRTTVERTWLAKKLGVDAALVVAPYYNKPQQRGMVDHFSTTAREGGLPVVLYNVPGRTGINIDPETSCELSRVDGIIGVKEASGSVTAVRAIVDGSSKGFAVLSGDDAQALAFFSVGACGLISVASNVAPGRLVELWDMWKERKTEEAAALDRTLAPLYRALFIEANPVPCKVGASMLDICADTVRPPLAQATSQTRETMKQALMTAGVL